MSTPTLTTNKTDFARWLDGHGPECPQLKEEWDAYDAGKRRAHRFGSFLRDYKLDRFNHAYEKFWLIRPELWNQDYVPPANYANRTIQSRYP